MTQYEPASSGTAAEERPELSRSEKTRVIFGAGIGNTLEWYDWLAYTAFAPFFADHFFRSDNTVSALLSTLAIFAAGFFMRPLGGLFFGWYADRRGRRPAMTLAMIVTAAGSLLIAVSPTYASIGVLASLLLLVARLAQGFGLGGEIGGSHTYLAEMAPRARRGLWSSSMYIAITTGVLGATLLAALLTSLVGEEGVREWAWRVPFVIGALLGLYAIYLRRSLRESTAFEQAEASPSLVRDAWAHRGAMLKVIGITVGATVAYYTWNASASTYAIEVQKIDASEALWAAVSAQVFFIAVLPLWGWLSDRWGRKPNMFIFSLGLAALYFPLVGLIQDAAWQLGLAMAVGLFFLAAFASIGPAMYTELFPARVRASAFAVPYSLAVAIFGGTAPYLQTYLAGEGLGDVFTGYAVVLLLIAAGTTLTLKETKGISLHD